MAIKNIFGSSYRQDYLEGYANGQNPKVQMDNEKSSLGYISGFNSGRMDYEEMNGQISKGIPTRIVTIKILEDFLLAGLLGLSIEETDDYTPFQLSVIAKWYISGVENYDPSHSTYLFDVLEDIGIQID
ncbi:hypothetical protein [Flavobacterium nackdongense]|uniref:Uncharacterized protein n=1 Tax=Flavobacterium nackdongense TaxID=2547394 RepID=A0A4P6YAV2_9FLAO|nr:hypothetical protein [Flavobacterium nackdongense]QBN20226.1 hypothetical protein E1750_15960 [Flavobacterium nackdongense]